MKETFYTVTEVAKHFRFSTKTIREWCRDGRFPNAFKMGRDWRIPKGDVDRIQNQGEPKENQGEIKEPKAESHGVNPNELPTE